MTFSGNFGKIDPRFYFEVFQIRFFSDFEKLQIALKPMRLLIPMHLS